MTPNRIAIFTAATALLVAGGSAQAETIRVEPGKWQVESTSSNPFTGPQTFSSTQCIREEKFDPTEEMTKSAECHLLSHEVSGNAMTWTMSCQMEQMLMQAEGRFESRGASASGRMTMSADMGGHPFTMEVTWNGTRIGPCE